MTGLGEKQDNILSGSMYKAILALSVPIIINNLIQTLYNLIDGLWISKIGSVEFASTSFVWPFNYLLISIGMGISVAATSILSQLLGAKENEKANKYSTQLIALAIAGGVIFAAIGMIISKPVLTLMGNDEKLIYFGDLYLKITLIDLPFTFLFSVFSAIMNSQGNTVMPMILGGISAVLNCILDPILMFTFDMGFVGAAVATVFSKALFAIIGFIILFTDKTKIKPCFKGFKFDKDIISKCIKVALPASVGQSGSAIGFLVLNIFIVSYGTATMAAYAMVNRISALIQLPAMGIGTALISIAGQNMGANNLSRAKEGFKKSLLIATIVGFVGGIFLIAFRVPIINFFMQSKDDMKVIEEGIRYLVIISLSMPPMCIFSILQGFFQGCGHTKYSMSMEIGRLWFLRIPMIILFANFTNLNQNGIWWSMSLSNLFITIYGFILYKRGKWMNRLSH